MVNETAQRDAQLRARMLTLAKIRDDQGDPAPAAVLASVRDDDGVSVDDDEHAERLVNDLIAWGFLEEPRDLHADRVKREFRHRRFRMTTKAHQLAWEQIPPHPGIADRRLEA